MSSPQAIHKKNNLDAIHDTVHEMARDMEYLDEINFESEYWWAEDMKVLDALCDEEHQANEQYAS